LSAALAGVAVTSVAIIAAFNGGWISTHSAPSIRPAAIPTAPIEKIDPKSVAVLVMSRNSVDDGQAASR